MIVLGVDDLVEWVREQYVREARRQMRSAARAKRQAAAGAEQGNGEWWARGVLDSVVAMKVYYFRVSTCSNLFVHITMCSNRFVHKFIMK
jgi:hypothetical protein